MTPVKTRLPRFLEHPARPYLVITLTLLLALGMGWPAADEFLDSREQRAGLSLQLTKARDESSRVSELEQKAAERTEQLAEWERKGVAEDTVHRFRDELVELLRQSGCRLRQVELGEASLRSWHPEEDPLKPPRIINPKDKNKSPYSLRTQTLTLSASGSLAGIKGLFARLHEQDRLLHLKSVAVRLDDSERREMFMELELILFNFETAKPDPDGRKTVKT